MDSKKKKNTEILKELKVGQDWLLNNIKARKLSYFGHLKRHDSLERHILEARLEGKRRKRQPTRRWTEDTKKWLPMSPTEAGREAQKREVFRRMVREATSTQTCQDERRERHGLKITRNMNTTLKSILSISIFTSY